MNTNVVPFPIGQPPRIGHFVRVGSRHRQFEELLAIGRMPIEGVVLEASVASLQDDLIGLLVEAKREIVLDTNVAELSCLGRFDGRAKGALWADSEGPLTPEHFPQGA